MYRLMAIAKYEDRYVIPTAHVEQAHDLEEIGCSLDFDEGPGHVRSGPFGEASGRPVPVAVETFHALKQRQTAEGTAPAERVRGRVNLLNWDGDGAPAGLFPRAGTAAGRRGLDGPRPPARRPANDRWSTRPPRCCLGYPDAELLDRAAVAARAAGRQPRPPVTLFGGRRSSTLASRLLGASSGLRRGCSTSPRRTRSTCRTGPTATPGAAARCSAGSRRAYRASGWLVDTHGELPDYLPMVLEFAASPTRTAGQALLQAVPGRASSCCGSRCSKTEQPLRRRRRRGLRDAAGRVARATARRCSAMADDGPPTESRSGSSRTTRRLLPDVATRGGH